MPRSHDTRLSINPLLMLCLWLTLSQPRSSASHVLQPAMFFSQPRSSASHSRDYLAILAEYLQYVDYYTDAV